VQGTDHGEHTCVHRLVAAGQATAPAEHNPDADAYLQSLSAGLTVKTEGLPAAADPPQGCWSAATSENLYLSTSENLYLSTSENWGVSPASSDSNHVASYLPFEWRGQAELQEVVVSATSNFNHVASYLPFECRGQAEFQQTVSALVAASAPAPPPAVDILDDLAIDDASFWTSVWEQN
jgi:hypothetical protein